MITLDPVVDGAVAAIRGSFPDAAVDIIRERVDGLGIAEPEVSRQGDTIVVDLPGVEDREQAEALVGQTAELRFRVVQSQQLPWEPAPARSNETQS